MHRCSVANFHFGATVLHFSLRAVCAKNNKQIFAREPSLGHENENENENEQDLGARYPIGAINPIAPIYVHKMHMREAVVVAVSEANASFSLSLVSAGVSTTCRGTEAVAGELPVCL